MSLIIDKIIIELQRKFPNLLIRKNVSWKQISTLGIGGNIPFQVKPLDEDLPEVLKFLNLNGTEVFILGRGSNIIGKDGLFDKVLFDLQSESFNKIMISGNRVIAGSGVELSKLIGFCAENGVGGAASMAGIPGTVGGALRMNAGRNGVAIGDYVQEISAVDYTGQRIIMDGKDINWEYRASDIAGNLIITSATFNLLPVSSTCEKQKIRDSIKKRVESIPLMRNAGCIFKNPPEGHGAGYLIESSGCKGVCVGDAEVSSEHGNFIVNKGNASEKDIVDLIIQVKNRVFQKTGIFLETEVVFVNTASQRLVEDNPEKISVAVLKGGVSHERAVSLESAAGVSKALRQAGFIVREFDVKNTDISDQIRDFNVVFPVLHGGFGEDGRIQKALEGKHLSYVGCDSSTSALVIDKVISKEFFEKNNIPTAAHSVLFDGEMTFPENLSLPVVTKPPKEGSTIGISIVKDIVDWIPALEKAYESDSERVLVEKFIEGMEITVGLIDGKALPIVEIRSPNGFYDYDAKYEHLSGETEYITPPSIKLIPEDVQDSIRSMAERAYSQIGARDMLRIDMIYSPKEQRAYVMEMNSIPGFTSSSLLPKAAAVAGIPYLQLCSMLVSMALKRDKKKAGLSL